MSVTAHPTASQCEAQRTEQRMSLTSRLSTLAASTSVGALGLMLGVLVTTPADATGTPTPPPTPSCGDESGVEFYPCAWDARHEGNGLGRSYVVNKRGDVVPVPHWVAHRLRYADVS